MIGRAAVKKTPDEGEETMAPLNSGRRTLLKMLAIGVPAAALASALPISLLGREPDSGPRGLEAASVSTFWRYRLDRFSVRVGAMATVDLELREVKDLGLPRDGLPMKERFAIVFQGPRDPQLEQGTYRFEHQEMGEFPLFIVPVYSNTRDAYYQASFGIV
jgi:hypothetical protein